MLTIEHVTRRANELFESCRTRWRKKLQKGAPKGVTLDIPLDDVLPFTRKVFQAWLWQQVGLQAIPCGYCRALIDVMSLSLDHKTPLRRGGGPELSNLQVICARCNRAKGEFTHEEYLLIVSLMEGPAAHIRQRLEGVLINGNMGNQMKNFPRNKSGKKPGGKVQNALAFEQLPAF